MYVSHMIMVLPCHFPSSPLCTPCFLSILKIRIRFDHAMWPAAIEYLWGIKHKVPPCVMTTQSAVHHEKGCSLNCDVTKPWRSYLCGLRITVVKPPAMWDVWAHDLVHSLCVDCATDVDHRCQGHFNNIACHHHMPTHALVCATQPK